MEARITYLKQHISELKQDERERGFVVLLAIELRSLLNQQRILRKILADTGDLMGIELKKEGSDLCVALLPEPDGSDRVRLVKYGKSGFFGHDVFTSAVEALSDALSQGYRERADGTLDRYSTTAMWKKGMAYVELLMAFNAGRINFQEFNHRLTTWDEAQSTKQPITV